MEANEHQQPPRRIKTSKIIRPETGCSYPSRRHSHQLRALIAKFLLLSSLYTTHQPIPHFPSSVLVPSSFISNFNPIATMLSTRAASLLRRRPLRSTQNYRYQPRAPPSPTPLLQDPQPTGRASAIGLASGALGAMCGVGGAVFVIPGLVRFASLPQRVAAGNALVAVTCIASTGAYTFLQAGCIDIQTAGTLGLSAALMTPIGAVIGKRVDAGVLRRALGGFMVVLSPLMPLRSWLEGRGGRQEVSVSEEKRVVMAAAGASVGFGSGMLGISGGSLFTPLIAFMSPEASFKSVLGTSFASMIIPTAIGAASYARMGFVTPGLVPPLVVGSVIGAGVGSSVALAVPEDVLRWIFAGVFAVLGGRILRAPIRKTPVVTESANARRSVGAPA